MFAVIISLFIDLLEIKSNTLFKSSIPLFARGISFNINEIFSKLKDLTSYKYKYKNPW